MAGTMLVASMTILRVITANGRVRRLTGQAQEKKSMILNRFKQLLTGVYR